MLCYCQSCPALDRGRGEAVPARPQRSPSSIVFSVSIIIVIIIISSSSIYGLS